MKRREDDDGDILRSFYLVESEIEFEGVTAEEGEDDGDEDDGQTGLSPLYDGVVHSPTSDGCQSDGQKDPDVEEEQEEPGHHHCHDQLHILSWCGGSQ